MKRILVGLALMAASCGGAAEPVPGPEVADGPDDVVLAVELEGGFVPVEVNLNRMPRFLVTGDRRLIFEGPVVAIYPGPLLPNVLVRPLDEAEWDTLLSAIVSTGLPEIDRIEEREAEATVADAPTTVVTFRDEAGEHVHSVYALGLDENSHPLLDLINHLEALASSGREPAAPYQPDGFRVLAIGAAPAGEAEELIVPWPLEVDPGQWPETPAIPDFHCEAVTGEQAAVLGPALQEAHQLTYWRFGNATYRLAARPLLPSETGCGDS